MTATTRGPRGPYAKTAEVRQRILEAGMRAFAESGYRAATMKDVALRAEISQRGLVHHFANKEELLAGVLGQYDQDVAAQVPESGGVDALMGVVEVVVGNAQQPWIVELYSILSSEAISQMHPAHTYYRERYGRFRRYAAQAFDTLRRDGKLSTELDSQTLAAAFTSLVEGLQTQWLYDRESVDVGKTLRAFLSTIVRDAP